MTVTPGGFAYFKRQRPYSSVAGAFNSKGLAVFRSGEPLGWVAPSSSQAIGAVGVSVGGGVGAATAVATDKAVGVGIGGGTAHGIVGNIVSAVGEVDGGGTGQGTALAYLADEFDHFRGGEPFPAVPGVETSAGLAIFKRNNAVGFIVGAGPVIGPHAFGVGGGTAHATANAVRFPVGAAAGGFTAAGTARIGLFIDAVAAFIGGGTFGHFSAANLDLDAPVDLDVAFDLDGGVSFLPGAVATVTALATGTGTGGGTGQGNAVRIGNGQAIGITIGAGTAHINETVVVPAAATAIGGGNVNATALVAISVVGTVSGSGVASVFTDVINVASGTSVGGGAAFAVTVANGGHFIGGGVSHATATDIPPPPVPTNVYFLLAEDEALKAQLQGLTVPAARGKDGVLPVDVWFRWPTREYAEGLFPFITLDLIDAHPDPERMHSYNYDAMRYVSDSTPVIPSNVHKPVDYDAPYPIPFELIYLVATHCRNARHDRILWNQLLAPTRLPRRFGELYVPTDDTTRRLDVLSITQVNELDSLKKRVFRRMFTVAISAEMLPDATVGIMRRIDTVMLDPSDPEAQGLAAPAFSID